MIRFFVNIGISLVAGAIGLLVAASILDGVTVTGTAFFIAVAIFTLTTAIIQPFVLKVALKNARAMMGATALVTTFIGLLVASLLSEGLSIEGADSWLIGTLIVWLVTMVAMLIVPILLLKAGVTSLRENNQQR